MIEYIKYIILGIIQGITEVLPISSSGHLIIFQEIFNIQNNDLTFEIFLHLASLIAIILYLSKPIKRLIKGVFLYIIRKDKNYTTEFKYFIMLIISTIPIVIFTLIIKSLNIEFNKLFIVGICLIINSIMIYILNKNNGNKAINNLTYKNALYIGLFQMIGIFPGISRSGSCYLGTSLQKLNKDDSAEYSFFLFIPSVLGALVLEYKNIFSIFDLNQDMFLKYILAFVITIFTTYFAFKILMKIIRKKKLKIFSIYSLIVGILIILYSIIKNKI